MSYYEEYKKMFPTVDAFDAVVEQHHGDDYDEDISPVGCHPFIALLRLRDEATRASLANPKTPPNTSPKTPTETPPQAPTTNHQPVAAPPPPCCRATTHQKNHA
jgi:hypothetical protein